MRVAVYVLGRNSHAENTCKAMAAGVKAVGDEPTLLRDTDYRTPDHDVAIFWGYVETLQATMHDYTAAGKPVVYLDLGYWCRDTHFKVSMNARHPTAYFQAVKHDDTRKRRFGVQASAQVKGSGEHILLAGLGPKAAWAEKEGAAGDWERNAITALRAVTGRKIVYRPKPSWADAKPLPGAAFSGPRTPLGPVLNNAYAVVARHSNVTVEGLVLGVPAFVWHGVSVPMGLQDLSMIETPLYPERDVVEQWLNDVAYCQWSLEEMRDGTCLRHLKSEGLIP